MFIRVFPNNTNMFVFTPNVHDLYVAVINFGPLNVWWTDHKSVPY